MAEAKTAAEIREPRSSSASVWGGSLAVVLVVAAGGYAYRANLHNQTPVATGASQPDTPNLAQPAERQTSVREPPITPPPAAAGRPAREARAAAPPVVATAPAAPSSDTRGLQASPAPTTMPATREGTSEGGPAPVEAGARTVATPATEPPTKSNQTTTRKADVPRPAAGQTSAPPRPPPSASATKLAPAPEPPPVGPEVTALEKAAAVAAPPQPPTRSIEELVASLPAFSPIDGLVEAQWRQSCASCHKWTKEALCKQGQTYAKAPEKLGRHPHPFGGEFKTKLKAWAETGCT